MLVWVSHNASALNHEIANPPLLHIVQRSMKARITVGRMQQTSQELGADQKRPTLGFTSGWGRRRIRWRAMAAALQRGPAVPCCLNRMMGKRQ